MYICVHLWLSTFNDAICDPPSRKILIDQWTATTRYATIVFSCDRLRLQGNFS